MHDLITGKIALGLRRGNHCLGVQMVQSFASIFVSGAGCCYWILQAVQPMDTADMCRSLVFQQQALTLNGSRRKWVMQMVDDRLI
jgi:hypothetical protein